MDINYSALIKECVSVPDAIKAYTPYTIRHNRIPCPFHGGKEYNLGLKPKWFHCFVCGKGGDVIDLTRGLFDLSWSDAVSKINDDFRLGLPLKTYHLTEEQKSQIESLQNRISQSITDELEQKRIELQQDTIEDILAVVERICIEEAPVPWDDDWSDLWCNAMRLRTELKEELELVDLERIVKRSESEQFMRNEYDNRRKLRQSYRTI